MNRIILIGNGFDLAHGLKTSYRDFIDDYWKTFIEKARNSGKQSYEDENEYEIVQNISRNFTNKAAMRERVVNKTYCEPLT